MHKMAPNLVSSPPSDSIGSRRYSAAVPVSVLAIPVVYNSFGISGSSHFFVFHPKVLCSNLLQPATTELHSINYNKTMVSANLRSLFMLFLALFAASASARQPLTTKPTFFGLKQSSQGTITQETKQNIKVRGGSTAPRSRWVDFVQDVKDDLMAVQNDSSRCSAGQVFHECVINYGSVMLGRF